MPEEKLEQEVTTNEVEQPQEMETQVTEQAIPESTLIEQQAPEIKEAAWQVETTTWQAPTTDVIPTEAETWALVWETWSTEPILSEQTTPRLAPEKITQAEVDTLSTPVKMPKVDLQAAKAQQIELENAENAQKEQERTDANTHFEKMLTWWATADQLSEFANANKQFSADFRATARNYFKTQKNATFFSEYSGKSPSELYDAVNAWEVVIWSKQYNLLPESQRKAMELYKKQQDTLKINERADFTTDNNTTLSFDNIFNQTKQLFSSNIREESKKLVANSNLTSLKNEAADKQNAITKIDDKLDVLEEEIKKEYPKLSTWMQNKIIRDRRRDLIREKNTAINDYNTSLVKVSNEQDSINDELAMFKYDDANNKFIYTQALSTYEKRRSEMRADEKLKFEAENKQLAADKAFENQKALAEHRQKLLEEWNAGWQYIDDWKGNLAYIKNGKTINVLEGLWKEVWNSEDDSYNYQIKQNDDWTFTVFWLPKSWKDWLFTKSFWINWEEAWNYIEWIWTWSITSYGWSHDNYRWLDIDWNIGDPITSPLWWVVKELEVHPLYWKTMVVKMDDWNEVRYSHLDSFKVWTTARINKWDIIWTIGNTWNVLKLDWTKPSASELKAGFGSHLDIVTTSPGGKVRSSKETEAYFNNIWLGKTETDVLTKDQWVFFNQQRSAFQWNPEVKAFEAALSSWWDLLTSLKNPSWPWDVASVFQFMKTLDPGSVVRESEFQVAASSAWVKWSIENMFQKLTSWKQLTAWQRKEFGRLALSYVKNKGRIYDIKYDDMQRVLTNKWIGGSNLPTRMTDLIEELESSTEPEGKQYSTSSWFSYNTSSDVKAQDNFFNQ